MTTRKNFVVCSNRSTLQSHHISTMGFIFKFGKYYLVTVLSEWLDLIDFVMFDSAVTNRVWSQRLLKLCIEFARRFETLFFTYDCVPISMPFGLWLIKRQFSAVCCEMEESFLVNYKPKTLLETIKMWLFGNEAERRCKANPNVIRGIQFHLSVFYNEPQLMAQLIPKCEHLQEIRVYYKHALRSRTEMVRLGLELEKNLSIHESFTYMVRQCKNLRRIQVGSDVLTHRLLTALIVSCRKLESVEVCLEDRCCSREQYFLAFHAALPMTQLLVQWATPLLWRTLLWHRGGSLRHLSLVEMGLKCDTLSLLPPTLTDLRLARVTLDGSLLCTLPRLRRLYIQDANMLPVPTLVTLLEGNRLYSLRLLDVLPFKLLTKSANLSNLNDLDLSCAPEADDTTLTIVGRCCPQLRELTIQFCRKITDKGLKEVLVHGKLVSLNMRGTELTNWTLVNLMKYCHGFKYFTLLRNRSISVLNLLEFIKGCPSLRYLSVFVDDPSFAKSVRKVNPRLKWKPY